MTNIERGSLSKYFTGVAVKLLRRVEATSKSNQHEFNGSEPLKRLLGLEDRTAIPTKFIWLSDEQEGVTDEVTLTWYNSRKDKPHRAAEYRLYYPTNSVSELMDEGDTLFIALRPDNTAIAIVARTGSTIQNQLLWMFGVEQPEFTFVFKNATNDADKIDFALRYILDELGIEPEEPEAYELDRIIEPLGGKFPTTREFSRLARISLPNVDPMDDPDLVLMAWLEREELLFRRLERKIVSGRLHSGFSADGIADVDGFLAFSLHVQNRRKSRAGQSLENQLEALLVARDIKFSRGAKTENKNKPDFIFPGETEYRNSTFPESQLSMLGAKSTCKDRWRQVLTEAERIREKHLLTLEPGISESQTDEMRSKRLHLVLPLRLHATYNERQQNHLVSVAGFLQMVLEKQGTCQPIS